MSYDFSDDLSGRSNDPEPSWLGWLLLGMALFGLWAYAALFWLPGLGGIL